ncbi:hypothetical protein BT63DRAFT_456255 [Microthyrium microscopicum]|uniref:Protein-lysine N-methyltransferase EFM4 n=1 Tax=Microthyrium microscopicum TaxID=703497 RepID=A0A6A6U8W0_9PEZI|nr:hypothetical protein BT63DRAFT_456255 [Microthyrium microscopicum]
MADTSNLPAPLEPSELGTKTYWDECYQRELSNHSENPEDEGTIWFSDSGAEEKMLEFLDELADQGTLVKGNGETSWIDKHATTFLDLGTGNGHLLFALRKEQWAGAMLGLDYSQASIELAKRIEQARQQTSEQEDDEVCRAPIDFLTHDLLSDRSSPITPFDVLLDKGTFDAISLSSDTTPDGRRASELYRIRVKPLLKDNGLFLITSCNWTEEELCHWFQTNSAGEDGRFVFQDRVRYPSFRFGGQEGQTVVTICFRKQNVQL